ncbi:MAG: hypothetical protein ACHREM_00250 [Polyangiales bacterium]
MGETTSVVGTGSMDPAAAFDPRKLAQQVQERVRGTIADLMPEDAWQAMIQREIKLWIDGAPATRSNFDSRQEVPPGVRAVVQDVLKTMMKEKVREALNSPEWAGFWDGNKQMIGPEVEKLVVTCAPEILRGILTDAVANVVRGIQYSIGR